MNDAMPVRIVERGSYFSCDSNRVGDPELFFAIQPIAKRFSFDVGHHVEEKRIRIARIEERQDVRVIQICGCSYLSEKPVGADDGGELGAKDFYCDFARVTDVACQIHSRHSASTELAIDVVTICECSRETL